MVQPVAKIWMNGKMVDWDKAQVHVLTHTLHYGLGVFEGIRYYKTSEGPGIFEASPNAMPPNAATMARSVWRQSRSASAAKN